MPNQAYGHIANPHCWSCHAEIGPMDRFCRACGAMVTPEVSQPRATLKKSGRRHAAVMFLFGIVILLFAAVHRDPADIILVVAFGLPLCGAGAITWRMA
jgi:hypothetical protein